MWIGLNPSTADDKDDDPTIRRCKDFTKRWGYLRMCMTNLFAFRSTDYKACLNHHAPIGEENSETLKRIACDAALIICAWGNHGSEHAQHELWPNRVRGMFVEQGVSTKARCLKRNADGSPGHPLYLSSKLTPQNFY